MYIKASSNANFDAYYFYYSLQLLLNIIFFQLHGTQKSLFKTHVLVKPQQRSFVMLEVDLKRIILFHIHHNYILSNYAKSAQTGEDISVHVRGTLIIVMTRNLPLVVVKVVHPIKLSKRLPSRNRGRQ